jgi:hypothetical protein
MSVTVASLLDIVNAIADQITDAVTAADLGGEALQVWPLRVLEPTPPCIDIYPATPFSDQIAYGPNQNRENRFTVRARVAPTDTDSSQELLLQLMDDRADTSVAAAIRGDRTLGGLVQNISVDGPEYGEYAPTGPGGYLIGAEWLARVTR